MPVNNIVLSVNPNTRLLTYDDGQLILGVKGDDKAQRVYFDCPKALNELFDDITSDDVTIYIDYKNAAGETYIQECSDAKAAAEGDIVTFSWLITNNVTYKAGEVIFNVCIKKVVDGALQHEWHTSTLKGKVLDAINVSKRTPEVITNDTVTVQNLNIAVNEYKASVDALNETLQDVDAYVEKASGYLGEMTGEWMLNSDLDEFTTPGIYNFNVNENNKNTYHILIVNKVFDWVYQSVFCNLTSNDRYVASRHLENGEWSNFETKTFAYTN